MWMRAAGVYLVAAAALTWPLATRLTTHLGALEGAGDPYINLWILGTGMKAWLADPDEEITGVEATVPEPVEDTLRVGWRVRGVDREGRFVYEQQAYVREDAGKVAWMRVFCSGFRRPDGA